MKLNKIIELMKKKKYYYVQRCPECGSRITGRYIKRPRYETDAIYLERTSLAHGELISYVDGEIFNNCYCEDCGHEWRYDVVGRLISKERYIEEGNVRGVKQRLVEFNKEHPKKGKLSRMVSGIIPKY